MYCATTYLFPFYFTIVLDAFQRGVTVNELHCCGEAKKLTVWIAVCAYYELIEVVNSSVLATLSMLSYSVNKVPYLN